MPRCLARLGGSLWGVVCQTAKNVRVRNAGLPMSNTIQYPLSNGLTRVITNVSTHLFVVSHRLAKMRGSFVLTQEVVEAREGGAPRVAGAGRGGALQRGD